MNSELDKFLNFNIIITDWTDVLEFWGVKKITKENVSNILENWETKPSDWGDLDIVDWKAFWYDFINETISLKVAQIVFQTNREIWRLIIEKDWKIMSFSYSLKDSPIKDYLK
jgi:hypothetical protein